MNYGIIIKNKYFEVSFSFILLTIKYINFHWYSDSKAVNENML